MTANRPNERANSATVTRAISPIGKSIVDNLWNHASLGKGLAFDE